MQKLINEQAKMKVGSLEYITAGKRIRELKAVLDQHNAQLRATEKNWFSLGKMADGFNKYFGIITAGIASFTGMVLGFRKLSEEVAKMDDVYSDVSKTTNLTRKEVVALNEEFKKMDTRTSRESLNNLAADAGKLGISGKKDILEFVDAGNQINVALGEDLGEGAIKNIGKITQVFKASTEELRGMGLKEQMLSVGSAINELGQSSTASEAYLVNFAQRLGGVASQAGISVQNILGYASALDQSGQAVEMSATALQNFIMKLMADPAKFARLAGKDVKEFTNLLKTDTNAAIIQVLTSMNGKGGFQALIPIFEEMGLDGARAVGVLSSLASNINMVTEAQEVSNRGFAEASSITGEYDKKNNNLQATLEKSRKAFNEQALELGEKLSPLMIKSTNSMTMLIKALSQAPEFIKENRGLLIGLGGALASFVALSAGAAVQTGILAAKTSVLNGVKSLYNTISGETLIQQAREDAVNQAHVSELEKLLTVEQQAVLQKKNLSRESAEYADVVKKMTDDTASAAQREVSSIAKKTAAMKSDMAALQASKISAEALVEQRRYEVYWAKQSGNATRIAAAEKRLEDAVNKSAAVSSRIVSTERRLQATNTQLATAETRNSVVSGQLAAAQNTALAAATNVASGATSRLTMMMRALWASMKANPIGWILTLVSLATSAIGMFSAKTEKASSMTGELATAIRNEGKEVNDLIARLTNSNTKESERKSILEELRKIQPNLVEGIDAESIATDKLTRKVQEYNDELIKRMALASKQDVVNDALRKQADIGVKMAEQEAEARKLLVDLQSQLPDMKIKKKKGNESIWDWKEISASEKEQLIQEFNKIFTSSDDWLGKSLKVTSLFPESDRNTRERGSDEYKGVDISGISQVIQNISDIKDESKQATEAVELAKSEVDNFKSTFEEIFKSVEPGGKVDNSEILKSISLLTDKQKLQEYILNQDKEISQAAQARMNVLNGADDDGIKKINGLIEAKEAELKQAQEMPGRTMQEIIARNQKVKSIQKEIEELRNLGLEDEKEKKKAEELIKEKEKRESDLASKIADIRLKLHIKTLSDSEKEIFETQQKYSELLAICQKYGLDTTDILDTYSQEMDLIFEESMEKEVADCIAAQEKIESVMMSSSDKQKADIKQKYADLIELAEKNGLDTIALREQINAKMNEELEGVGKKSGGADLFGMAQEDWDDLQGKVEMALDIAGQLTGIWDQASQIMSNNEKKELQEYERDSNKKKDILKKQLDAGRISQEQYNSRVSQLDDDLDKKKTEIAKKEAKRNKASAITNAIINTATSIMKIWAEVPKADFGIMTGILTGLAAAAGAAQIGVIMSQPLPEYAEGGMTDGAKMYVAGEAGQEWISPNWMLNDRNTGPIIKRLEMVRSGILSPEQLVPIVPDFQAMTSVPLFASGGYTSPENMQNNYYTTETNPIVSIPELSDMNENIRILCEYLTDPRNRQASISNDLLRKNDEEMNFMNRLKRL